MLYHYVGGGVDGRGLGDGGVGGREGGGGGVGIITGTE